MSLALLTPWQQLLWLVCAFILIVPVVAAGVNAVIEGYFRAKRKNASMIAKAIAEALKGISTETLKKMNETLDKVKAELEKKDVGKNV